MRKFLKKLLPLVLALAMVFSTSIVAFASPNNINAELRIAYKNVMSYAKDNNIPLNMTFKDFAKGYEEQTYPSVQAYEDVYYSLLKPEVDPEATGNSIGKGDAWYYNTGTTLPQAADYSRYNLLNTVRKGDIIHEANGGFGITGHTAIVEGIYWSSTHQQYYIRIIEAIDDGVVRSVLDDTRVDDKDVSVYRVTGATSTIINNAVGFCVGELGSSYNLDFAKDTSSSETDWYCSEVVWAGYYNQGINIETTGWLNEPGITPRDITRSSAVSSIAFR